MRTHREGTNPSKLHHLRQIQFHALLRVALDDGIHPCMYSSMPSPRISSRHIGMIRLVTHSVDHSLI